EPRWVALVIVPVIFFGFERGASYGELCAKALELGFELAPTEAGLAMRLQYPHQPRGEWIRVASEPVMLDDGTCAIFASGTYQNAKWLDVVSADPDARYAAGDLFAFIRPEPPRRVD